MFLLSKENKVTMNKMHLLRSEAGCGCSHIMIKTTRNVSKVKISCPNPYRVASTNLLLTRGQVQHAFTIFKNLRQIKVIYYKTPANILKIWLYLIQLNHNSIQSNTKLKSLVKASTLKKRDYSQITP